MVKLVYDKKLDKNAELERLAKYYDDVDLETEFDFSKAVLTKGKSTSVKLSIPSAMFKQASTIGHKIGSNYQEAMKMALGIGLKALQGRI